MFDAEANAAAVERAHKKYQARYRRAFETVFSTPEGRAFVMFLAIGGGLYKKIEKPEDEGRRQAALMIREAAGEYGLFDKWQLAEKEDVDFHAELQRIVEQTEARENE